MRPLKYRITLPSYRSSGGMARASWLKLLHCDPNLLIHSCGDHASLSNFYARAIFRDLRLELRFSSHFKEVPSAVCGRLRWFETQKCARLVACSREADHRV